MTLESAHERYFYREVRRAGAKLIKLAPIEKGTPDRLVMAHPNRIYFVELKTSTGRLSERQKLFHARLAELDIPVAVLAGKAEIDTWISATLIQPTKGTSND